LKSLNKLITLFCWHIADFSCNDNKDFYQVVESISKYDRNGYKNLQGKSTMAMLHYVSYYKIATKNWKQNPYVPMLLPCHFTTDNVTVVRKMNLFIRIAWDEFHR
jgi:hypothetical protein